MITVIIDPCSLLQVENLRHAYGASEAVVGT